ncbi:MYH6_7 [Lepeophtheirus salmonis]|uniref:MYH6_7 n=1 Tax=Lepeophtheirus salmonis TaxID=72036 RepID=A0A7R8H7B0_LEPSM|nr:MYH6_7 [Lepeophtheirus salmonis]CAF2917272.1 MYH6_7 [Lepeophtheirus salmonis]
MPGTRIVLKAGEEDPDPSPYLFVSNEQRIKNSEKPYDPKRSCWVPDSEEKFLEGLIQETTGGKVKVQLNKNKEVIEFKQDQVAQVNPPKFDMCDDMSNLTYLNDASVLFNLKARYTYSGLFCIAVNPYKRFPIYTRRTVDIYRMKRRNEVPPHIFGIAEGSYHSMCMKNKNQSILITGESGAGKTENTKKVITYFAFVGSTAGSKKDKSGAKKVSLEDQVVQTNPVLEAFGNAKTVRNDNSSRFVSTMENFIRVWFNNQGKMAGGDIETYLLEKSRVTYQSPMERSYHIFYFMITHQVDLRESCMLSEDIFEYPLMSMGKVFVESIDDKEEMSIMDEAFDILGFTQEEKYDVYKVSSLCMHLSKKLEFNGHGEITTAKNLDAGTDILSLFNWCDSADELYDRFCSIIKNIFGRLFRYLVDMCNNTLIDPTMKKVNYIGVLDIAGFEIFDFNTLEQLMINFVNEKLQQFFNHNMFVLEQEEYMREGIEWVSVDFGMDLAACIDLFEKPMVSYNVTGWLDKNRDPINDTVIDLFKKSKSCNLMSEIYADHPGQTKEEDDAPTPGHRRGKKRVAVKSKTAAKMANFKTVCSYFKDQLNNLINMLMSTEPSFIRCIVPNGIKTPGLVDPFLVMHQLTCNGVLEGIRICTKGFPNRVMYADFRQRYAILAPKEAHKAMKMVKRPVTEDKKNIAATHAVMDKTPLTLAQFQYGHTKIFFRAGVLGQMEENAFTKSCGSIREDFSVFKEPSENYMMGQKWQWWQIWLALKPNLKSGRFEDFKKELAERIIYAQEHLDEVKRQREVSESKNKSLTKDLDEIRLSISGGTNAKQDILDKIARAEEITGDYHKEIFGDKAKSLTRELKEYEMKLNSVQNQKADKEMQIKQMKDEISHQEEIVNKLNREKKNFRLEKQLDEIEDTWEREKKHRNDIEKQKRVIEGNLKLTQEAVSDLERINLELNQVVQRKEKELGSLNGKIEDEQTLGSKINLQIKELNIRLEELDEDLEAERLARARADKAKCNLKRELEELHEKLEETGSNTTAQIALNTRREEELSKLKSELEESNISHESTLAVLRQKHNSSITDMADNMDQLNKQKAMVEKERNNIMQELESITLQLQAEQSEKTSLEKSADGTKRKLMIENCDLVHHLEEGERLCASLNKDKTSFTTQLEDAKRLADAETRERINLLGKMRNLEHELIIIKEHLDQEFDSKQEVERQLSKAFADVQLWKTRFETEGVARIEEIERDRSKISSRLREAEDTISALQEKIAVLEKSKSRMSTETWKRNFDKVINEWKCKAEDLSSEITASQSECRNFSSEYFRIKSSNDEIQEHLDTVKRENKNLADEIKDLMDQLGEGGRSIHDLDKTRRKLEIEKEELQAALEEAEATLEQEENKVLRTQLEMSQVRQEIDRRIREKEEEFDHHKKNHLRCMDSMQASLEAETRAKEEILRIKKKLESDINEMEIALDHANKAHNEARKATKRTQAQLADINSAIEEERKICNEVEEQLGLAERKSNALFGELEESKALLEASKRGQNQVEQELCDSKEQTSDLQMSNQALLNNKRKLESDIHQIQADIDNLLCQSKAAEEKAKRAMVDADLALKAEEASAHASNAAINVPAKLESRIRDIETELNKTILMTAECHKYVTKGERRVKELGFQTDENKKNQDRMADLVDKLQQKIHSYKKQIEEAEEIAAINLAKYRKVQQDMEEAEERTKIASEQVHRIKNARCASVKPSVNT